VRFFTSGGLRLEIYKQLAFYLPIPEVLVTDLMEMWVGGDWTRVAIADRVPIWGLAAWWTVLAWATGYLLLAKRIAKCCVPLECFVFYWGVGLHILSLAVLAVGLCGGLAYQLFWFSLSILVVLLGVVSWLRRRREGAPWPRGARWPAVLWQLSGFTVPVLLLALLSVLPPWEFDVREYHLQVPKEWYQAGRIGFLAHNVYGNMPLGAEMHALGAMVLWGGQRGWWYGALAGKVLIGSFAILGALAIAVLLRGEGHPQAARLGALIYLSTPWILHVSTVGLIEGAWAAYYILAVVALWKAIKQDRAPGTAEHQSQENCTSDWHQRLLSPRNTWYALAGVLAGAASACKYPALVLVVIPMAVATFCFAPANRYRRTIVFLCVALASVSPWYLKNLVLTGNPTYPFLYGWFGGPGWDEATSRRFVQAHGPPIDGHGHRFSLHQVWDSIRDIGWESDKLSVLLGGFAILGCLRQQPGRLRRLLSLLLVMDFAAWWLLTHRYDRFFVPCFSLIAVWSGLGTEFGAHITAWRRFVAVLITFGVALNCLVVSTGRLTGDNRMFVALEELRRDERHLLRTHPAHLYLNDHVPPGAAALVIGDAQVFDIEVPVFYHTCWNKSWWEIWMKDRTTAERRSVLREHKISHVFFHWAEIARYRSPGNYGFSEYVSQQSVHEEFVKAGLLRPVPVPSRDGWLSPESGEVFEVVY